MAGFFCNLIDSASDSGDQNVLKLCQAGIYSTPRSADESHMRIIATDERTAVVEPQEENKREDWGEEKKPRPQGFFEIKTFIKNSTSGMGLERTSVSI